MPQPDKCSKVAKPMPGQLHSSSRPLLDFFSRAISSFQHSRSELRIICTAAAATATTAHHQPGQNHDVQPAPIPPRTRPRTLIVLDSSFNPPTRAHLRMATSAISDHLAAGRKDQGRGLDGEIRLLLLLSVNNADKAPKPAAFDQRLAMMWAFAGDVQQELRVASPEANGEGGEMPLLSVDLGLSTLPYFHEKSAAMAELAFYNGGGEGGGGKEESSNGSDKMEQAFLVGYDTLIRIFNPKYYGPPPDPNPASAEKIQAMQEALDPFFARAKLRVTMRTGDEWGDAEEQRRYLDDLWKAEGLGGVGGSSRDLWGRRIEMVEGREVGADVISSTYARKAAKERDRDRLDAMVTPAVRWWVEQGALYAE